jgi:AraC-like DNA-binding protein
MGFCPVAHSSGVTQERLRGRRPERHTLRQRFERTAELYLRDCYARRTAARADEFALQLELTPQYLRRVAVSVFGVPLLDFLRARQLRYAEQLLLTTSYSTAQIAVMSAFGTHPTFYRVFKAAHGMTPGQYRKQVRK